MACIGCGLALNADGTGRVDIDTEGGLTCVGGAGGTTNDAGDGLAILIDPANGNSASVGAGGLFVPGPYEFEALFDGVVGGAVSDPAYPTSTYTSSLAELTVDNSGGAFQKLFIFQASVILGQTDLSTGNESFVEVRVDAGVWTTVSHSKLTANNLVDTLCGVPIRVAIPAGNSSTVEARLRHYTGNLESYAVNLYGWGGFSS